MAKMENFKRYYSERGPSFEEIDCMDPVAFYEAKGQWARDKAVHVEKVKIFHERLRDCYQREEMNFRDNCQKEIKDYWQAFQLFKRDGNIYLHILTNQTYVQPSKPGSLYFHAGPKLER